MLRQLFHLVKMNKENSGDPAPGAESVQDGVPQELNFEKSYSWGNVQIHLEVEAGIIKAAYAVSDHADSQFMEMIGIYLEARKFERKEILKILDMIPVRDEEENTIMRDIYNLMDEQLEG